MSWKVKLRLLRFGLAVITLTELSLIFWAVYYFATGG